MEIEIEVSVKEKKVIQVEFPTYRKSGLNYYKCFSKNKVIHACPTSSFPAIQYSYLSFAYEEETEESNEKEYEDAFNKTLKILKS